MHITLEQKRLLIELEEVSHVCRFDYLNYELNCTPEERTDFLYAAKRRMVLGFVVETYTLVDEILSDIVGTIYLSDMLSEINDDTEFWASKPLASFSHNVLDTLYLLQKVRIINDIESIPSEHMKAIERLNALRNALAHSYHPELRKSYSRTKTVLYRDTDIYTPKGIKLFEDDRDHLIAYLWFEAYGESIDAPNHSPE